MVLDAVTWGASWSTQPPRLPATFVVTVTGDAIRLPGVNLPITERIGASAISAAAGGESFSMTRDQVRGTWKWHYNSSAGIAEGMLTERQ